MTCVHQWPFAIGVMRENRFVDSQLPHLCCTSAWLVFFICESVFVLISVSLAVPCCGYSWVVSIWWILGMCCVGDMWVGAAQDEAGSLAA